jgi:hypothetical protein
MQNKIRLFRSDFCWMAEYTGPEADTWIKLFGSATIPTAYTAAAEASLVLQEIQRRNPDSEVTVR